MNWVKKKLAWAGQNKLFWANLALMFSAVAVIWIWPAPKESDLRIRLLGMGMQLIGVVTVWVDIAGSASMFRKTGMLSRTWTWLKAGFGKQDVIVGVGAASCASATSSARATVRWPMDSSLEIPVRLETLEKNFEKIDEDVQALYTQMDQQGAMARELIAQETAARALVVAEIRQDLGEVAAGNFQVLAFGAIWLAIGVVLATLAPEVAKIVNGNWKGIWATL